MSLNKTLLFFVIAISVSIKLDAQKVNRIDSFRIQSDILITIDHAPRSKSKNPILIIYALPNGNSTAQTMGKKIDSSDDWHFDIQHIKAQTEFIRQELPDESITVAYLENDFKSWPKWKTMHTDYVRTIQKVVDTLMQLLPAGNRQLCLNGHSGGGRFIFSYLDGVSQIPSFVKRISFLDSDYGYEAVYLPKIRSWLSSQKSAVLNVFAYNDSIALYNGQRVVSDTGGTWYRSRMMLRDLSLTFRINQLRDDSLIIYSDTHRRIQFFLKKNPDQKIYHTQQVARNGFIHSILAGTGRDSKRYRYYGEPAYTGMIPAK